MEENILSFNLLKSYTELKNLLSEIGFKFTRAFDMQEHSLEYSGTFYYQNKPIAFFERYNLIIFNSKENNKKVSSLERTLKSNGFIN